MVFDTDKSREYLRNYQSVLGHLRDEPVTVLELGVLRGGSLLLWADWFPNGRIIGLDLNAVELQHPRIRVVQGSQDDRELLDSLGQEEAPDGFDVIIDDASHLGRQTAGSFMALYGRHLKPGGVYVIEDWGTGYWRDWTDGMAYRSEVGRCTRPPWVQRVLTRAARVLPPASRLARERFPSHDAGMVGVVKQLVDWVARVQPRGTAEAPRMAEMRIFDGQVFCIKPG